MVEPIPVERMDDLIEPKQNPAVLAIAKLLLPAFLRWQRLTVNPTANCITTIRRLRGQQTVLLLNHPDRYDPVVAFTLSALAGEDFYYLAARELFDQKLAGWCLQNCGTYSVIRGFPEDAASKELTISLIGHGNRKLIEFPEGDVTGNDDHIFALKRDGLMNMLEAQRRLGSEDPGRSIFVLPICSLYETHADTLKAINKRADDLASTLGLVLPAGDDIESKTSKLLAALIPRLRDRFSIAETLPASIDAALRAISRSAILKIADSSDILLDATRSEAELLYDLRSQLRKLSGNRQHDHEFSVLQQMLITANTLEQPFSGDVAGRLVDRMEYLVFGRFTIKGSRTAWLDSGSPIDLSIFINSKTTAIETAVAALEREVYSAMTDTLQSLKLQRRHSSAVSVR